MDNGNGGPRKWQVYGIAVGMILTIATLIFQAGMRDAGTAERLNRVEREVDQMRVEFARKDLMDQRLAEIEKAEARIEALGQQQNDQLDRAIIHNRRPR